MKIYIKFNIINKATQQTIINFLKTITNSSYVVYLDRLWLNLFSDEFDIKNFSKKLKILICYNLYSIDNLCPIQKIFVDNIDYSIKHNIYFKSNIEIPCSLEKKVSIFLNKNISNIDNVVFCYHNLEALLSCFIKPKIFWFAIPEKYINDIEILKFLVLTELKSILDIHKLQVGIMYDVEKHNIENLKWNKIHLSYKLKENDNFLSSFNNFDQLKKAIYLKTNWLQDNEISLFFNSFNLSNKIQKLFICLNSYRLHYLKNEDFFKKNNLFYLSLQISQDFLSREEGLIIYNINKLQNNKNKHIILALFWYYFFVWNNIFFDAQKRDIIISSKSDTLYFRKFFFKWIQFVLVKDTSYIELNWIYSIMFEKFLSSDKMKLAYQNIINDYIIKFIKKSFSKKILYFMDFNKIDNKNIVNIFKFLHFLNKIQPRNLQKIVKRLSRLIKSIETDYVFNNLIQESISLNCLLKEYKNIQELNIILNKQKVIDINNNVNDVLLNKIKKKIYYFGWIKI